MTLNKFVLGLFLLLIIFNYSKAQENRGKGQGKGNQGRAMQGSATVYGTLSDNATRSHVEYANVMLYRAKDSSLVNGTITDKKGRFVLKNVPIGNFYLVAKFIGYKTLKLPAFKITPNQAEHNFGEIFIETESQDISEVTVAAEKKLIEFSFDKKIVNVEKNLTTAGGTALDVMQNIPSVTVDADGVVSLRGSSNVSVLIDGKPSVITGSKLDQIPASAIENVEIITNPSAKYSPDGMSGIINIKLKKKISKGFNGIASVGLGTWQKYNTSINMNYSFEKLNLFFSWDFRKDYREGFGRGNTFQYFNGVNTNMAQRSEFERFGTNNSIKFGADYALNPSSSVTFTGNLGQSKSDRKEDLVYETYNEKYITQDYYTQDGQEDDRELSADLSLNYKKNFKKKDQALTADFQYTNSGNKESNDMLQSLYLDEAVPYDYIKSSLLNETTRNNFQMGNVQINYNNPIDSISKFEVGYHGTLRITDNDYRYDTLFNDFLNRSVYLPSINHFVYREQTSAVYGTYANTFKSVQVQLGIRAEYAERLSEQKTQSIDYSDYYVSVFPTLHVARKLGRIHEVMLSYSRRLNRPDGHSLNPFVDRTRAGMISYGNPKLKPEYFNSYEIGHSLQLKKTSLFSTLFYRQIDDVIKRYVFLDSVGMRNMTFLNMTKGISSGLEFILDQEVMKGWRINANFSYFYSKIDGTNIDNSLTNENFGWTAKLSSNTILKDGLSFQVSGNYRSPMLTPQGEMAASWNVDLAFKKDIFKEQASISFRISDVFNTQQFNVKMSDTNLSGNMVRKRESRVAFLTLSYKINEGIKQRQRKRAQENFGSEDRESF